MAFDIQGWLQQNIPDGRMTGSGWLRARCPFHPDTSPSFAVKIDNGNFGCLAASCGKKGGLVRLVKEIEGLSWREAFAKVEQPDPFRIDDDVPTLGVPRRYVPAINNLPQHLVQITSFQFPKYLRTREFDTNDALRFGLRFAEGGEFRGQLFFPFWDLHGEYRTYTRRIMADGPGKRYLQPSQSQVPRHLYGVWLFQEINHVEWIFVVEGQFDVMRLWSLGLHAVGLSTAGATPAQRNQIARLSEQFRAPVVILFDRGELETEQAAKVAADLRCLGTSTLAGRLPDGADDPDEMRDSHVQQLLDTCKQGALELTA